MGGKDKAPKSGENSDEPVELAQIREKMRGVDARVYWDDVHGWDHDGIRHDHALLFNSHENHSAEQCRKRDHVEKHSPISHLALDLSSSSSQNSNEDEEDDADM